MSLAFQPTCVALPFTEKFTDYAGTAPSSTEIQWRRKSKSWWLCWLVNRWLLRILQIQIQILRPRSSISWQPPLLLHMYCQVRGWLILTDLDTNLIHDQLENVVFCQLNVTGYLILIFFLVLQNTGSIIWFHQYLSKSHMEIAHWSGANVLRTTWAYIHKLNFQVVYKVRRCEYGDVSTYVNIIRSQIKCGTYMCLIGLKKPPPHAALGGSKCVMESLFGMSHHQFCRDPDDDILQTHIFGGPGVQCKICA